MKESNADALNILTALKRTYLTNPTLNAARSELLGVHEQLPQALSGWRPSVFAGVGLTYADIDAGQSSDSTSEELSLELSQSLYNGGSTFAQVRVAKAVIAAQGQSLRAIEQQVLLDAAIAYVDVVRDHALLELSQNNRDVIARQLEATQDRFDVGELTRTDVSQAQARLARGVSEITKVRGTLNSSKAVFEELIGERPRKLVRPRLRLTLPNDLTAALLKSAEMSPVVRVAELNYQAAQDDVENVYGELLPDINFFAAAQKTYGSSTGGFNDSTSKSIGLSASIPLYQAGGVRSRVREAKHAANRLYLSILEAKRRTRQQMISAWEILASAQAEIKSREVQVKASEIVQEGVRAEAELGARTVLDSLDADQELLDAQVALVIAKRNELVAQIAVLAVLGDLSPQKLGFPEVAIDLSGNVERVSHEFFDMGVDRVGLSH